MTRLVGMVVLTLLVGGCDWVFGLAEPTGGEARIDAPGAREDAGDTDVVDAADPSGDGGSTSADGGTSTSDAGWTVVDGGPVVFVDGGGMVPGVDAISTN